MGRTFKAQNLARHEPEWLIGCAAYGSSPEIRPITMANLKLYKVKKSVI
jgi:hypothetical protein